MGVEMVNYAGGLMETTQRKGQKELFYENIRALGSSAEEFLKEELFATVAGLIGEDIDQKVMV
ncbi:MAG: hypothetical protein SVM80_09590 [Halobacteriota archaeon]|nr:hypothetical protein [Halobacteriota archaeon]